MTYYVLQALPCLESWEAGKCPTEYAEKQIKAIGEWKEGERSLLKILKYREEGLEPEIRLTLAEAREKYSKQEEQNISKFWNMCELTPDLLRRREKKLSQDTNYLVYKNMGTDFDAYLQSVKDMHEKILTFSRGTWEAASAFLHGLPHMQTDVVRGNLTIHQTPPAMREADIMIESTHYVVAFMEAVEHLSGWCYGLASGTVHSMQSKAWKIFKPNFS